MAFLRTFVVSSRSSNQIISYCRWTNRCATKRRIHRSVGAAWLRKGIGPIIGSIIVAIIVELLLSGIIPPRGFIKRRTAAMLPIGPAMMIILVMFTDVVQTLYFPPENGGETTNNLEASRETARAAKISFEIGIGDAVEKFAPINRTGRD